MSNPEIQILFAKGLKKTLVEMLKVRGGDTNAYNNLKYQLEENGSADLMPILENDTKPGAVILMDTILRSMNLSSNFADQAIVVPDE
jgi:hypothetical protein